MSSILTNMSAMSAVANLAATQKSLAETENEVSTGLAVSSASDNAAYYSIATNMRTQVSNLSAVSDSLNLGTSVVGTATSALGQMTSILQKIQADLVSAKQPGTDLNSIGTDIKALQAQLVSSVGSASFNNVNLLDGSQIGTTNGGTANSTYAGSQETGAVQFVASVTGTGANTSVSSIDIDATQTNFGTGSQSLFTIQQNSGSSDSVSVVGLTAAAVTATSAGVSATSAGVSATDAQHTATSAPVTATSAAVTATSAQVDALAVDSTTTVATINTYISAIGQALTAVNNASETLGAAQTNINLQATFISSLSDSITSGVGSLVDADMNEASTRLSALQTQQQLGIQALSVANQNSQIILKLFGG